MVYEIRQFQFSVLEFQDPIQYLTQCLKIKPPKKNKKVSFAQYQHEPDALLWSELPNNIQTKIKSSNLMHPHCIVDRKIKIKKDVIYRYVLFFLH